MSATPTNIFDLEIEWEDAPDGFSSGVDFKTWLAANVIQLRDRIAWLTTTIGEDGLATINRLIAACERGDIYQIAAPDLSIARDEILEGRAIIKDRANRIRELESLRDEMSEWIDINRRKTTALREAVEQAHHDLMKWGNHAHHCAWHGGLECNCGYHDALRRLDHHPAQPQNAEEKQS